jgi:hypothetical protein
LCRLPNETPEICEIGRLLRDGNARDAQFIFQEDGYDPQQFEITNELLDNMISNLHFSMAKIEIRILQNHAFKAFLRLNGTENSISGFPRTLVRDQSETMSKIPYERMKLRLYD